MGKHVVEKARRRFDHFGVQSFGEPWYAGPAGRMLEIRMVELSVKDAHDVASSRVFQHLSRGGFQPIDAVERTRGSGVQQRVARGRVEEQEGELGCKLIAAQLNASGTELGAVQKLRRLQHGANHQRRAVGEASAIQRLALLENPLILHFLVVSEGTAKGALAEGSYEALRSGLGGE